MTESLTLSSQPPDPIAAAPVDVDLNLENTSSPLDRKHWIKEVLISLGGASIAESLTPSSQLPSKLLLAGGGTCAPPTYSGCAGGHGTLDVHVVPLFGSPYDTTGAFGFSKIVNVYPPQEGAYVDYEVTLKSCLYEGGTCDSRPDETQEMTAEEGSEDLALPVAGSGTVIGATFEYAANSFSFHLAGRSNHLESGAVTSRNYTIATLPKTCGTFEGSSTFRSEESGSVAVPQSVVVSGCPVAELSYEQNGFAATLDGSGSSTPVDGRSIVEWHWDFGDGSTAETTFPIVTHEYSPGSENFVSLYVVDSAGARSDTATQPVVTPPGATLTISTAGTGSGAVTADGIHCPPTCTHVFPKGTSVALNASPVSGSTFSGWAGDCSGTDISCQVLMTDDRSVSAAFAQNVQGDFPELPPSTATPSPPPITPSPPATKIIRLQLRVKGATFRFGADGQFTSFECALLAAKAKSKPRFRACRSPKQYVRLSPGRYVFEVRAVGSGGVDETPAKQEFVVRGDNRRQHRP